MVVVSGGRGGGYLAGKEEIEIGNLKPFFLIRRMKKRKKEIHVSLVIVIPHILCSQIIFYSGAR